MFKMSTKGSGTPVTDGGNVAREVAHLRVPERRQRRAARWLGRVPVSPQAWSRDLPRVISGAVEVVVIVRKRDHRRPVARIVRHLEEVDQVPVHGVVAAEPRMRNVGLVDEMV